MRRPTGWFRSTRQGADRARRGDRALRRRLDRSRRGRGQGRPRDGAPREARAGRLARRLPDGSRPAGPQRRRPRCRTVACGGREGARPHEGRGRNAAYRGAVLTARGRLPSRIAVCDVGGASTEIAVGNPGGDPDWIESVDLGSVRLATRAGDPAAEARRAFAHLEPPSVEAALVVGGSARATRRLVGAELGEAELADVLRLVEKHSPREIARRFGVDRARAELLPAGVILLAEVRRRLDAPVLRVCDGGIREGTVLAALDALAA